MRRWVLLCVLAAAPAQAAVLTLTTTSDTDDGSCSIEDCSLREAVVAANATPGPDEIDLPAGVYTLTTVGAGEDFAATGDLDLRDDVILAGAGAASTVIDGNALDRVFDLRCECTAAIRDLTVRNGQVTDDDGAGIAALSNGQLSLLRVRVVDNHALGPSAVLGNGGGIGIDNVAALELVDGFVAGNSALRGGGIGSRGAPTATIHATTIVNNTASVAGGGIWGEGSFTISGSTLADNTADNNGGGVLGAGEVRVLTSTLTGNAAPIAGAIRIASGGVTLENSTLLGNTGLTAFDFSAISTLSLRNSILYDDVTGVECETGWPIQSLGYNIDRDGTCVGDGPGDLPATDPLLGPLELVDGTLGSYAPLPASPAVNAGTPGPFCADVLGGILFLDQRDVFRPYAGDGIARCDIGAVEYLPETPDGVALLAAIGALAPIWRRRARARCARTSSA